MALTSRERTAGRRKRMATQGYAATLVYLPENIRERMTQLVESGCYPSRRALIEHAMTVYLTSQGDHTEPQSRT